MSNGTTSISELPISNSSGTPANIQLQTKDSDISNTVIENAAQKLNEQRNSEDAALSQKNVAPPNPSDFAKQVQQEVNNVATSGVLKLPERDVPRESTHITQDQQTKPTYVPDGPDDYIKHYQTHEEVQHIHKKREEKKSKEDALFKELQTPILVALLYFLFQLPVVNSKLMKHIPKLFKNDGNLNTQGYLFNSVLFGSSYYLFTKATDYLAE